MRRGATIGLRAIVANRRIAIERAFLVLFWALLRRTTVVTDTCERRRGLCGSTEHHLRVAKLAFHIEVKDCAVQSLISKLKTHYHIAPFNFKLQINIAAIRIALQ